jgi:hypothetical protein
MKTNIQKKTVVIVLSILTILVFTFTSCQKEQLTSPVKKNSSSEISPSGKIAQTNYLYLVGVEGIIEGPDKIVAPNGDTMIIEGEGTLSTHPKSVTGGGEFEHVNVAGTVLGSGTWQALELLAFVSWGTSPILPANFEAGKALIRIHLSPGSGGNGYDAILQIYCVLPGANFPPGFEEGVRLVVPHVANFNDPVHGQTLFIRQ